MALGSTPAVRVARCFLLPGVWRLTGPACETGLVGNLLPCGAGLHEKSCRGEADKAGSWRGPVLLQQAAGFESPAALLLFKREESHKPAGRLTVSGQGCRDLPCPQSLRATRGQAHPAEGLLLPRP